MKQITVFLFCLGFWASLHAQPKYLVPGAQVQPQWVFPIWFEDGNGDRDTVYFCYDPDASDSHAPNSDTVFGEFLIEKDTSAFWVGIAARLGQHNNVTQMIYVSNTPFRSLFFNKGIYPLKMYWDVSLLNSPDLPYPDNSPQPRARIDIFCDDLFRNCPWDRGIVIHGDSLLHGSNYFPTYKDSMVFQGDPNAPVGFTLGNFSLELKNYNAPLPVGISKIKASNYVLYPNPVQDNLIFAFPESTTQSVHWSIYDYTGKELIRSVEIENKEHFKINTAELESGYYILKVNHGGQFFSKPFVKN